MYKWLIAIAASMLACCWPAGTSQAENPLLALLPFRIIDADPDKSYPLQPQHGPWMIMATSFAGPGAQKQAQELVYELRKQFKLEAFTHKRTYDFSKAVVGRGINKYGEAVKMRHKQDIRFDEIAVLVGQFSSLDTSDAQDTLETVKYLRPAALKLAIEDFEAYTTGDVSTAGLSSQRFAMLRYIQRRFNPSMDKKNKGPMGKAFLSINPLKPLDGSGQSTVDPFVVRLNEDVEFNLLDNPAPFTVKVATFQGMMTTTWDKDFDKNAMISNRLVEAAEYAHRLTMVMRSKGVDAYEFHDRNESIVTIGSFKSVGTRYSDGRIEIDPRIMRIVETYKARRNTLPNGRLSGLAPRTLTGIPFDIKPAPIRVPR